MAADAVTIQVKNWNDHQHYSKRNPPWIKLHCKLLNNAEWGVLSGDASKLLVTVWLLAAKEGTEGTFTMPLAKLSWRTHHASAVLATLLKELQDNDFLTYASAVLAPSSSRGTENREREKETDTPPTPPRGAYEDGFEKLWSAYPNRPNQSKRKAHRAWRARVREGTSNDELMAGVLRYKERCAIEKTEPRYVMHCATFLGPDHHWKLDHKPERDPRKDYNPAAAVEAKEAEARRAAETRKREAETNEDVSRVQQWIASHKAEHQMLRNKLAMEKDIDLEDTAGRAMLLAAVTTEIQRILEAA